MVFDSVDQANCSVGVLIREGIVPGAIEMMDALITQAVEEAYHFGFPLDAGAVLIVELDGHHDQVLAESETTQSICRANGAREIRRAETTQQRAEL